MNNENLQQCHACGGYYPDEYMADWTICRRCLKQKVEEDLGEEVYMDALGIVWTQEDIKEAGGIVEINKMVAEADVRNNI